MRHRSIPLVALLMAAALLAGGGRRAAGEGATAGRSNRLIGESSPYLLLHAHNPVDWYPWGEEALERARREQRPIFLSVGYSTCYWCHVMEREVFSNPEIAALMNRWFVSIKVDREERPELDEIYMTATQLLTRRGGWPNSVFLTPDLEPFFAGTYFPPEDSRGRPGFPRILEGLSRLWENDRPRVLAHASRIASSLQQAIAEARHPAAAVPSPEVADRAVAELARRYDEDFGGFGAAPKFPSPARLYLLWQRAENGDAEARRMVLGTLRWMGQGAIYDHLDGGFHRYAMDREWRVPHFEKMLYDNAHLGELLAMTAAATGDPELERLARGTFDFVLDRLRLPNGAFKSAIDAETDAVEGAYYIWTREEFAQAVGKKGYALLAPIFGIDGDPNLEEDHYTLYLTRPLGAHAEGLGIGREELLARMAPHLGALRRERSGRELPFVDDKVLTDWNGMMIAALASGGELLSEPRYLAAAASAADFVLTLRDDEGVQLHAWRNGQAKIPAFLDDYAFLVRALLALHRVTGEARWLREAVRLSEQLESRLRAPGGGYYTSEARPDLLFQALSSADGAIPSGNGIAVLNQLQLAEQSGKEPFRRRAEASLKVFAADLESHPQAVPSLALAVYRHGGAGTGAATTATGGGAKPRGVRRMQELARQVVEASASLGEPAGGDGWRRFEVELEIREGWHVNANPASQEFLVPTRLEGEVRGVEYPPGESFQFDFAPDEIRVYSGSSWLRGEVRAEQKELRLRYQACDDRRCLPPVTETLSLR